jgi:hypothetical protein
MPSAFPLGMMVALWIGWAPAVLSATIAWPPSWYAVSFRFSSESTICSPADLVTIDDPTYSEVANRYDFGWEIAHAAVSRRPPISHDTIVARTHMYTYTAKVWELSIVQGPFSVAPCQLRFATFSYLTYRFALRPHENPVLCSIQQPAVDMVQVLNGSLDSRDVDQI